MLNIKKDKQLREVFEAEARLIEAIKRYEDSAPKLQPDKAAERIIGFIRDPLSKFFWAITEGRFHDGKGNDPDVFGFYKVSDFCDCVYDEKDDSFRIISQRYGAKVTVTITNKDDISTMLDLLLRMDVQDHIESQLRLFGSNRTELKKEFLDFSFVGFSDGIDILRRCRYAVNDINVNLPTDSSFEEICRIVSNIMAEVVPPEYVKAHKKLKRKPKKHKKEVITSKKKRKHFN